MSPPEQDTPLLGANVWTTGLPELPDNIFYDSVILQKLDIKPSLFGAKLWMNQKSANLDKKRLYFHPLSPMYPLHRILPALGRDLNKLRKAMKSGCWMKYEDWKDLNTWRRSSGRRLPLMNSGHMVSRDGFNIFSVLMFEVELSVLNICEPETRS